MLNLLLLCLPSTTISFGGILNPLPKVIPTDSIEAQESILIVCGINLGFKVLSEG